MFTTQKKAACTTLLLIILAVSLATVSYSSQSSGTISSTGMINYWPRADVTVNVSKVIGVNNLSLGFMPDWEWKSWLDSSVRRGLAQDASFKLVRMFDFRKTTPRLAPCVYWNDSSMIGEWDWSYVDLLVQRVFEIGAEPLFTLGWARDNIQNYIPNGMSVNSSTGLPYPASWGAYCREWVKHFKLTGRPVRFYETMNEPWAYFGWNDYVKIANFMAVVNAAAQAMKAENPNVMVSFDGTNRKPVLDYWLSNGGADLGFISFHKYDGFPIGQYPDETMLSRAETFQLETSPSYYGIQDARQVYYNARGKWIPVINSESNFNGASDTGTDPKIQQMIGTIWETLLLRKGILEGLSYNVYYSFSSSASWEKANKASGGLGFGMVNSDNNKPWYPYHVQKMLGTNVAVGDTLVESTSSSNDLRILSWLQSGKLKILLILKVDQTRTVFIQGVTGKLYVTKIDNTISWETPALQTNEIDVTEPLILYGYTVVLLSL
jgi:hypothetical protein